MKKLSLSSAQWKLVGLGINFLLTLLCLSIFLLGYFFPLYSRAANVSIGCLYLLALGIGEQSKLFSFDASQGSSLWKIFLYSIAGVLIARTSVYLGKGNFSMSSPFLSYCFHRIWSLLFLIHPFCCIYAWYHPSNNTAKKERS